MIHNENNVPHGEMMLHPHQEAFVERVFNPATSRVVLLIHETGLGSSTAIVATVRRLLADMPNARVLHIAPRVEQHQQVSYMLTKAGVPVLTLDRYRFREITDSQDDSGPIPTGIAVATSVNFANQPDIREFLGSIHWDLVVIVEAQTLVGQRKLVLNRLHSSADRFILTHVRGIKSPELFAKDETTIVEWKKEKLVDREGKPLVRAPGPAMHRVTFPLDLGSEILRGTLEELGQLLRQGTSAQAFVASALVRAAGSSPAALERLLRRVVERSKYGDVETDFGEPFEEDPTQSVGDSSADETVAERASAIARRGIEELEALETDLKLDVFLELMESLRQGHADGHICVLTEMQATLFYVVAGLEDRGISPAFLHGGLSAEERFRAYDVFTHDRKVMVATRAVIQGDSDSIEIAHLVFYEVPRDEETMRQVIAHFDRAGRDSQLNIHVLAPES